MPLSSQNSIPLLKGIDFYEERGMHVKVIHSSKYNSVHNILSVDVDKDGIEVKSMIHFVLLKYMIDLCWVSELIIILLFFI